MSSESWPESTLCVGPSAYHCGQSGELNQLGREDGGGGKSKGKDKMWLWLGLES